MTQSAEQSGLDWDRLQELFTRALALAPHEREIFLERETADHPALRRELRALIETACDNPTAGALSRAVSAAFVNAVEDQPRNLLGRIVGKYRLISVLGQGGTGTVYLAERADHQYSAQVAIKIIHQSLSAGNLDSRFRAERQILASFNHPNIARLVDAGETDRRQPYLVMEYVEGEPLDKFCDSRQLDLRERLELFRQICAAVQYAHQNLIVHRDLKPANILVTADGKPKLLDFGIAKLLSSRNGGQTTEMTRVNDRLLTPEYASPEQILGNHITTASDIYSLGVVLYQLLCGLRPYRVPESASQLELERSICISDPERPSAALLNAARNPAAAIHSIVHARSTSIERLSKQLQGDIDAIILKALRKEPEHRYSSVEQLAADVRRYLAHEPVHARQGNWLYYGQRFARRHTAGVLAGAGFLAFVIGVAIVMSVQRQQISTALAQARVDAQRAETVSDFMLDVFGAADPFVHFGQEPTARSLLEQAARRIQTDLDQQPSVRARLMEAIGRSYRRMGQPERAVPYLSDALRLQRTLSPDQSKLGSTLLELAIAQREAAMYDESDRTFAEALEVIRQFENTNSEGYAQLLSALGRLEMIRSNTEAAQTHFVQALELMRRVRGSEDPEVGAILIELSGVYMWRDDAQRAEEAARSAVRIFAHVPETHPDRVLAERELAKILLYRNRFDEAAPLFEKALAAQRLLYGDNNAAVAETLGSLAQLRSAQRKYAAAEQLIREALAIHQESGSTIDHEIGFLQTMLAMVVLQQNRAAEAEPLLRNTLDLFAGSLPSDHQYVASAEYYLGESLLGQGKLADAEAVLTASMNRWKRTDAPAWRAARSKNALGEVLYRQGRIAEAEQALVSTFRELAHDEGADLDAKERAKERISRFYTARGETAKLARLERELTGNLAQVGK